MHARANWTHSVPLQGLGGSSGVVCTRVQNGPILFVCRGLGAVLEWTKLPAHHINEVLACNFDVMKVMGDRVLRPFLQDTIQVGGCEGCEG